MLIGIVNNYVMAINHIACVLLYDQYRYNRFIIYLISSNHTKSMLYRFDSIRPTIFKKLIVIY